jgi:hypothetical protein
LLRGPACEQYIVELRTVLTVGRGPRMFDSPDHDLRLVNRAMRDRPVAGFFAQGQIGPVGSKVFVHRVTSALILFHAGRTGSPGGQTESLHTRHD